MNLIEAAWHFIFGWAGIDMLIGFAALAIALLEPPFVAVLIPNLRTWAIGTAVIAFTCMGCIAYGYNNGLKEKQRQWDAALVRELELGEKARAAAERDVPVATDRGMFRGDPANRDGGKSAGEPRGALRGLDPYHLFRR
jgi:hypothetical protein